MKLVRTLSLVILIHFIFLSSADASVSLGCGTEDGVLSIVYLGFEGDGIATIFGDFQVSFKDKHASTGLFNWFKMDDQHLRLIVFSAFGRETNLSATKISQTPDKNLYQIDFGSVQVDGHSFDLKGLIVNCGVG